MDRSSELSPTITTLDTKRNFENLSGSPLVKRKNLFGKEYYFYDDGSVLVVDPTREEYHFITREGRQKGKELRISVEQIIKNDNGLSKMKMLGEGGFSKVFELDTFAGPIAVKATNKVNFLIKEMTEEATIKAEYTNPLSNISGKAGKKIVQRMSLTDTLRLLRKLDQAGIKKPEYYGFSVKRNPGDEEIQEFQFMEKIDRPTMLSISEALGEAHQSQTGAIDSSKFAYTDFLAALSTRYFADNNDELIKSLFASFYSFVKSVKEAVPNIADLDMDNIFLIGYDEVNHQFEFMVIDPIEEEIYIPLKKTESNALNPKNIQVPPQIKPKITIPSLIQPTMLQKPSMFNNKSDY